MAASRISTLFRRLRSTLPLGEGAEPTDAELLERFVRRREAAAIEGLVRRYAFMVWGVCERVLGNHQDAEDAFQATFVVLVRRAASIKHRSAVGNWIYGVAHQTARKARATAAKRRGRERQVAVMPEPLIISRDLWPDLLPLVDAELSRLPDKYRAAIVLCDLKGITIKEAADRLGLPQGTLASHLARGRTMLAKRLTQRGLAMSGPTLATLLANHVASASAPASVVAATVEAATLVAAGQAAATVVSVKVAALAEGVVNVMFIDKLKTLGVILLTFSLFCGGGAILLRQGAAEPPAGQKTPVGQPAKDAVAEPPNVLVAAADLSIRVADDQSLETALPAGAIVRLGTTRHRAGWVVGPMKLSPDGKLLITGGPAAGNGLFVWEAATGRLLLRLPFGVEADISRDGERLFVIESRPLVPAKLPLDPKINLEQGFGYAEFFDVTCAFSIYQIATGKLVQQIQSPNRLVHFEVTPDERTLALEYALPGGKSRTSWGSWDYHFKTRLELYDLKAGRRLHDLGELPRNNTGNGLVRFAADGKTLFAISSSAEDKENESTVRRFDVATGELNSKKAIAGAGWGYRFGYSNPMRLKADGKTLIVSGTTIWDLEKETVHWASKGELNSIIAFMPDGRTLIGSSREPKRVDDEDIPSQLVHWDMEADREIRRLPARTPFGAVAADGKTCYGSAQYRWFRFDFASGKEIDPVDAPTMPPERIAFSPDGKYVGTPFGVWDRSTGKRLYPMPILYDRPFFFTPDSKTFVYGGTDPIVLTLDVATGKPIKRKFEPLVFGAFPPVGMNTFDFRMSPDGKVLAAFGCNSSPVHIMPIILWDWASGKLIGKLEHDFLDGTGTDQTIPIVFSPDSKHLTCLGYPEKRMQVWRLADRKLISDKLMSDWPLQKGYRDRQLQGYRECQIIDGGSLVAASWLPPRPRWKGMLEIGKGELGKEFAEPDPKDLPATMPPMPDGLVRAWDAATGKEKYRLTFPRKDESEITPLCSPDGKLVVTANSSDSLVRFWDLASGKEVGQFHCPGNGAYWLTFSPDSAVLAVSTKDTTVLLVDVRKVLSKR